MNTGKVNSASGPGAAPVKSRYKEENSVAQRKQQVAEILQANPDCVPVVCQAADGDVCDDAPYHLFLISADATLESLAGLLREKLHTSRGMIMTINGRSFQAGNEMSSLHNVYKDPEDGLLYIMFSTVEPSFPVVETVVAVVIVVGLGLLAYKLVAGRGAPVTNTPAASN